MNEKIIEIANLIDENIKNNLNSLRSDALTKDQMLVLKKYIKSLITSKNLIAYR